MLIAHVLCLVPAHNFGIVCSLHIGQFAQAHTHHVFISPLAFPVADMTDDLFTPCRPVHLLACSPVLFWWTRDISVQQRFVIVVDDFFVAVLLISDK